jgi:translation initiation factor 1
MNDMKQNGWKDRLNIVYSTNPDFQYENDDIEETETLPKEKQPLRITLDKRNRGGKKVTLITGFTGKDEDLQTLGKSLKTKCGVGGTVKDGEIIIQGDFRNKLTELLRKDGYQNTKII